MFKLISGYVTSIEYDNIIVAMKNEKALTSDTSTDLSDVLPCNHEELDKRIITYITSNPK